MNFLLKDCDGLQSNKNKAFTFLKKVALALTLYNNYGAVQSKDRQESQ